MPIVTLTQIEEPLTISIPDIESRRTEVIVVAWDIPAIPRLRMKFYRRLKKELRKRGYTDRLGRKNQSVIILENNEDGWEVADIIRYSAESVGGRVVIVKGVVWYSTV